MQGSAIDREANEKEKVRICVTEFKILPYMHTYIHTHAQELRLE